jgi:hypothetical protein
MGTAARITSHRRLRAICFIYWLPAVKLGFNNPFAAFYGACSFFQGQGVNPERWSGLSCGSTVSGPECRRREPESSGAAMTCHCIVECGRHGIPSRRRALSGQMRGFTREVARP